MHRILIVEDEEKAAASLRKGFAEAGFAVDVSLRGDEGLVRARAGNYDLLVLDIMLPRRSGWAILSDLRASGIRTPVVCLTARDAVRDRVRGLELGADDYLIKPFAFSELLARARTVLRRSGGDRPCRLWTADLELDLVRQRASRRGTDLELTPKEFALLALLVEHSGEVLSRATIAQEVWRMPIDGNSNAIEVAIRRLREKADEPFSKPLIHTVRGVGYVLQER